ncbi:MAG: ABC transporter ATP-binding protein [Candidatus Omnitrophica bacterium]|nr:ABC transporter ATP-binding protein [Candidatus Omnitrophota bacterium]
MTADAITIQGLVKSYGALKAVDGIDLAVAEGDFVAFLGPNGAGKTTTINAITGLSNFQSGSVRVFGMDVVADYRRTRPLIGLCPQEFNFDPFLSIHKLLVYQAGYFGVAPAEASHRAQELLRYFRLGEKRNIDFRKLSGGMKRRLLLCRALVHDPKILILDEPTAGADLELKYRIWDFLTDLNRKGKTIFLTTHYMEEAERLANKVTIIHRGKIIHQGDKATLLGNQTLEQKYLELTKGAGEES